MKVKELIERGSEILKTPEGGKVDYITMLLEQDIRLCFKANEHLSATLNHARRLINMPYQRDEVLYHLNKAEEALDQLSSDMQAALITQITKGRHEDD